MKHILLIIPLLYLQTALAQTTLRVIRATSKKITINDGGFLDKNAWTLSPGARPDVFTADRTRKTKWVTFYTDIDSIRIKVKPGGRYNFVILLNGKDSCYTQVASAITPESMRENNVATHDTIPFTLTAYNAIAVKAVINNTDTLNMDFDASSFDFHLIPEAILKKTKLLANQPDALAGKSAPNYHKLNKATTLQMGNMVWHDVEILPAGANAHGMDGRFGWNVFEGKQVEVDYDKNIMIIHSKLPKNLKGYVKANIIFGHAYSFPYIKSSFELAGKSYAGNFGMDTGSEQALVLDSAWITQQNFPDNYLKPLKSTILHDGAGKVYETKRVMVPTFQLSGFNLTNVPALIFNRHNPPGFEMNFLGNDVLKRFNIILDFKNDQLYIKPNHLISIKYQEKA
jgi:hypothetical protein